MAGHGIDIVDDFTRVEWLEITDWTTDSGGSFDGIAVHADKVLIQYVIIHGDGHGIVTNSDANGITVELDGITTTVRNSIVYDVARGGILIHEAVNATLNVENCTVYSCKLADSSSGYPCVGASDLNFDTFNTINARNVLAMGGVDTDFGKAPQDNWGISDANVSGDSTAPGGLSFSGVSASTEFVSLVSGEENLHLSPAAVAIGKGMPLGVDVQRDIDQQDRAAPWDIGADEH